MRFEFELVKLVCAEQGFGFEEVPDGIEVFLGEDCVLCMKNDERDGSGLIGFKGTPWHTHGNLTFSDSKEYLEMTYLDALAGLGDGTVLICAMTHHGTVKDRWLVHCVHNDEFKHMQAGEKIIVSRAQNHAA